MLGTRLQPILGLDPAGLGQAARRSSGEAPYSTLFDLPLNANGLSALEGPLVIGGQSVNPHWSFRGRDATATTWNSFAGNLIMVLGGAGANQIPGELTPTAGAGDLAVRAGTTPAKYFNRSSGSHMIPDGYSAICEVVFRSSLATDFTFNGRGPQAGISLTVNPTACVWAVDGVSGLLSSSTNIAPFSWNHSLLVIQGRTLMNVYTNGVPLYPAGYNQISTITSLVDATPTMVLNYRFSDTVTSVATAWVSQWIAPDGWLPSAVLHEWALQRFARCLGILPSYAWGSSIPRVISRTGQTHVRRYVGGYTKLVPVGHNWLALDSDATGTSLRIDGGGTNQFLYSSDINNAAWSKDACTVTQTGAPSALITTHTPWGIVGSVAASEHGISQSVTSSTAKHQLVALLRRGAQPFALLSATAGSVGCYFDLLNGLVGSPVNGGVGYIEPFGDSYYKVELVYDGPAASHPHKILAAPSDGVSTYAGNGSTVDLWVAGVQHDVHPSERASTYIRTEASVLTRSAEQMQFAATGNVDRFSPALSATVNGRPGVSASRQIISATDGQAATNFIELRGSTDVPSVPTADVTRMSATQASHTAVGSSLVGTPRSVEIRARSNRTSLLVDGLPTADSPDTTAVVPVLSVLNIGSSVSGTLPFVGSISSVKSRGQSRITSGDISGDPAMVVGPLCATAGMPCELHFPQLVDYPYPGQYTWTVAVTPALVGATSQTTEKWSVTPDVADIGSRTVVVTALHAGVPVAVRTSSLTVVPASLLGSSKVLVAGDSVSKDGRWQQRVQALSASVQFVGHTTTTNGAIPTAAITGTTAYYFSGSSSPFWHSGALDIPWYITTYLGGTAPDILVWAFGTNDMRTEGVPGFCAARMVDSYTTLIAAWAASAPNCKQVIGYSTPVGVGYSTTPTPTDYRNRMSVGYDAILRAFTAPQYRQAGVFLSMDRVSHWTSGDALHPNESGYTRLGEAYWSAIAVAHHT